MSFIFKYLNTVVNWRQMVFLSEKLVSLGILPKVAGIFCSHVHTAASKLKMQEKLATNCRPAQTSVLNVIIGTLMLVDVSKQTKGRSSSERA